MLGIFWMNQHSDQGKNLVRQSMVGLDRVKSLSLDVRTFAGRFNVGVGTPPSKSLSARVRGDFAGGYRFAESDGKAVFEWPRHIGTLGAQSPGTTLDVGVPEALPMTLSWYGQLASVHADLTRLKPTECAFHGIASSMVVGIKATAPPEEIRIWGLFSNVTIRIHGACPVRLVGHGPFLMRALPSDFEELAPGRGKDRVDFAEGRGRPLRIDVSGTFVRIKIERLPLTAVMTEEESDGIRWKAQHRVPSHPHRDRGGAAPERAGIPARECPALLARVADRMGNWHDLGGA